MDDIAKVAVTAKRRLKRPGAAKRSAKREERAKRSAEERLALTRLAVKGEGRTEEETEQIMRNWSDRSFVERTPSLLQYYTEGGGLPRGFIDFKAFHEEIRSKTGKSIRVRRKGAKEGGLYEFELTDRYDIVAMMKAAGDGIYEFAWSDKKDLDLTVGPGGETIIDLTALREAAGNEFVLGEEFIIDDEEGVPGGDNRHQGAGTAQQPASFAGFDPTRQQGATAGGSNFLGGQTGRSQGSQLDALANEMYDAVDSFVDYAEQQEVVMAQQSARIDMLEKEIKSLAQGYDISGGQSIASRRRGRRARRTNHYFSDRAASGEYWN